MIKRKIKSDVLFVGFAQVGVAALSLLLSVLLTHNIAPVIFGEYALVTAVTSSVVAISVQWLTQSTNRFLPVAKSDQEKKLRLKTIIFGLIILNIVLFICAIVLVIFVCIFYPNIKNAVIGAIAVVICSAIFTVGVRILQASFKSKLFSMFMLLFLILKLTFVLFGIHYLDKNIAIILWAEAFAYFVLFPAIWVSNKLSYDLFLYDCCNIKMVLKEVSRFWSYGGLMTGWFVGSAVMMVGDRYLLGLLRNATEVGIYAANYNLINGSVGLAAAPVMLVLHPYLMKYWAEKNADDFASTLSKIVESIWKIGLLIVSFFCIFSGDIAYYLFPASYVAGHLVMPIAVIGILLWNLGIYIHKPLECDEKSGILMCISICCAAVSVLMNFMFLPKYGFLFAAVSTSFTYLIYCFVSYFLGRTILKWNFPLRSCVKNLFIVCFITLIVVVVKYFAFAHLDREVALSLAFVIYVLFAIFLIKKFKLSSLYRDAPL